jgi:hypothetical protein
MRLLLIHGLGRTPLSLALLGRRLSRQGHNVRYFGYAAFQESFDQIVGRLVAMIRATAGAYTDHQLTPGHTNYLRTSS